MRKLRFHEKKLLKKVDFVNWSLDNNIHETKIIGRYRLKNHDEYTTYNKLSREIRELARKIKEINPKSPFRTQATQQLLEKLYSMGLIPTKQSLELADSVTASSFCRRRLPVVMVRSHMAENLQAATKFVQHGHVRVGPEVVLDPAFLVTKSLEDFITWTNGSAIRKHVMEYNDERDDFDLDA
uniref:U3 small nucleolar ribonucleoprotein protein IMP3 n=1 Tax=Romanomermis culicivorax TaxID=13658 RepID=A0A915INY6_ROMCU